MKLTLHNIKYILLLPVLAVIVFSCRKDDPINPPINDPSDTTQDTPLHQKLSIHDISLEDTNCFSVAVDTGVFTPGVIYSSDFQYKTPCFNPNNSSEFIYYYKNSQDGLYQLIKYNLQTGQKTIVKDAFSTITPPQWGTNDQIVYNPNYNVSIMNSDGSGITQISSATANLYPAWDGVCENLYWQHTPVLGHPYYLTRKNILSNTLDTLMYSSGPNNGVAKYIDISSDNKLIVRTAFNNESSFIAYSSLDSFKLQGLVDIGSNQMQSLTDICWHPNGEDFFFTVTNGEGAGLFKMNINNLSEATKLVTYCGSKYYINISCSPDGNFIVGERRDAYRTENNVLYQNSFIYLLNLNTLEETKIELE